MDEEHLVMVEILLNYGASPNEQDNNEVGKNTPIHKAIERN